MPTIRRLLIPALLLTALASLGPVTPAHAQNLAAASPDLLPVQAAPGSPSAAAPPASATPQQSRPTNEAPGAPTQSFPSRGGGYQCERSRPTS